MDRIPPEICHLIFCFACTDGGYTGRSLSAVSKSIRSISRPAMLQSMSIIGYNQLLAFLNILEEERERERQFAQNQQNNNGILDRDPPRHVKYLFISAHPRNTAVDPKALTPEYARKERAYEAFGRILRLIAPTVKVLHVFFIFYRTFLLLPLSLPVLQELSLHGPIDCPSLNDESEMSIKFPSLRHLHITSPFPPRYLTDKLAQIAPELRHFRLCAPDHNEEFLVDLQAILGELSGIKGSMNGAGGDVNDNADAGTGSDIGTPSDSSVLSSSSSAAAAAAARMSIFIHCPGKPQDNWMDLLNIYHRQMLTLNRLAEEHKFLLRLLPPLRYGLFRTVPIQDAEVAWMQSVAGKSWWAPDYAVTEDVFILGSHRPARE